MGQEISGGAKRGKKSDFTDMPVSDLPEDLQEVIADPLDDSEIRHYLPDAKIIKYSDLSKYKAITQLLPNEIDYCIILYEDSPNNGHWTALLRYNKGKKGTIEFFDPYGNMFDTQLSWTSLQNRQKLGQGRKLLTPLLDCAVQNIVYNPIKYQQDGGEINDCGRHCIFRILCLLKKGMDLEAYFEYMKQLEKEMQLPPDGIVSSQIDLCSNEGGATGGVLTPAKIKVAKKLRDITLEEALYDLEKLKERMPPQKDDMKSLVGNRFLDYYFFPYRMDTESRKGVSLYDFLNDTKLINAPYVKTFITNNPQKTKLQALYDTFRLYYGSIASFKPIIASYIYSKYKPTSIMDISAGWGGRLLGAVVSDPNVSYTGFDTNTELKKPYAEMIKQLGVGNRAKVIFKDSSKVDYSKYNYDMVFTSPPYFTIEKYENMPEYSGYDEWVNTFLEPVVRKSYDGLKRGGVFVLNIPDNIYESVKKILGRKADESMPLVISKRDNKKKVNKKEYTEKIYTWRKP